MEPKVLFRAAVTNMRQQCDLRKKDGEAIEPCLPRKSTASDHMPWVFLCFQRGTGGAQKCVRVCACLCVCVRVCVRERACVGDTKIHTSKSELQPPALLLDGAVTLLVSKSCSSTCTESWCACAVHPWVLSTINWGYCPRFSVKPPLFNNVLKMSTAEGESAQILEEEITSFIRVVQQSWLLLPVFCHFQKGGGLHPILDLWNLNKHLIKYKYKNVDVKDAITIYSPQRLAYVSLKDAYFHISLYPAHRTTLRVAYRGTGYEFFGTSFRALFSPKGVQQACRSSAHTSENNES